MLSYTHSSIKILNDVPRKMSYVLRRPLCTYLIVCEMQWEAPGWESVFLNGVFLLVCHQLLQFGICE